MICILPTAAAVLGEGLGDDDWRTGAAEEDVAGVAVVCWKCENEVTRVIVPMLVVIVTFATLVVVEKALEVAFALLDGVTEGVDVGSVRVLVSKLVRVDVTVVPEIKEVGFWGWPSDF